MKKIISVRQKLIADLDRYHQSMKDAIGRMVAAKEEMAYEDARLELSSAVAHQKVVLRFLDPEPPGLAESLQEFSQAVEQLADAVESRDP